MPKIIHGFIGIEHCSKKDSIIELVLISRKDCRRLGSRVISRGCDHAGNCSNQVETELVTIIKHKVDLPIINSYTIVRGSIALPWTQSISMFHSHGKTESENEESQKKCLDLHFTDIGNRYKDYTILNLIDKSGS